MRKIIEAAILAGALGFIGCDDDEQAIIADSAVVDLGGEDGDSPLDCATICRAAPACVSPCVVDEAACLARCGVEEWDSAVCDDIQARLQSSDVPIVDCTAFDAARRWPVGRACRDDTIAIDLPLHAFTAAELLALDPPIPDFMEDTLEHEVKEWLMAEGIALTAHVEPIFAGVDPGWEAYRLRHWRLTFRDGGGALRPLLEKRCEVQDLITSLVIDYISPRVVTDTDVFVSRECDATPQTEWYHAAMGMTSQREAPRGGGHVTIAMLEAPISEDDAQLLGASIDSPLPGEASSVHGLAMGLFVREVAPAAKMTFYRALEDEGGTPVGNTARAFEAALRDHGLLLALGEEIPRGDKPPLVINLSLGWPPEYNEFDDRLRLGIAPDAVQQGEQENPLLCREAPIGQSVFTMLAMLRSIRANSSVPVMVFAAEGNRTLPGNPPVLVPEPLQLFRADPTEWPRFYPAQWGLGAARWEPIDVLVPVHAVGRTAPTRMALLDALGARLHVAAPGVSVPVPPHAGATSLPVEMTGTSISTALMSAVAASQAEAILSPLAPTALPQVEWEAALARAVTDCGGVRVPWLGDAPANCAVAGFDITDAPPPSSAAVGVYTLATRLTPASNEVALEGEGIDRWAAGSATPQPHDVLCPNGNCKVAFSRSASPQLELALDLELPPGRLNDPRIDVQWSNASGLEARTFTLTPWEWAPGRTVTLQGDPFAGGAVPSDASFQFSVQVVQGGSLAVKQTVWLKKHEK